MLQEIIVVEGQHDKAAVLKAVQVEIIVTGGFAISKATIDRVRLAQARRGVIILTDPDYAGDQIRRRLSEAVPGCRHAFVPRIDATRDDDIGVENASPEAIRAALGKVRTAVVEPRQEFEWMEMLVYGLTGHPDASCRRASVGKALGIGYASAKQFFARLNGYGITREEFEQALAALDEEDGHDRG